MSQDLRDQGRLRQRSWRCVRASGYGVVVLRKSLEQTNANVYMELADGGEKVAERHPEEDSDKSSVVVRACLEDVMSECGNVA